MNGFERIVFFIASPIFSLPLTISGVFRKSELSLKLMALTLGFLSSLYVPSWSNDKVVYFDLYNNCKIYGASYLVEYLSNGRPDFLLHTIVFCFAQLGIPASWFFFFVTSWTAGVFFYIFSKIASKFNSKVYFLGFLMVLFSFSYPDLFSGIRFYFASSFVFIGLYKGIIERKNIAIFYMIIAVLVHFSALLFLPLYLFVRYFFKESKIYRNLFLASFLFMLLPKSMIADFLGSLGLSGGYELKASAYLGENDFIERGISDGSSNYLFVYLMSIAWSVFAYLYLVFTAKYNSILRSLTYLIYAAVNVFFSVTTVYSRYLLVAKFMFVLMLLYEQSNKKSRKMLLFFLCFLIIGVIANVIVMRNNISLSYFNYHVLSFVTMVFKEMSYENFIK